MPDDRERLLGELRITGAEPHVLVDGEPPWSRPVPLPEGYRERMEAENREIEEAELDAAKTKRDGDRIIIKTMRFAVWGCGAILVVFVTYIIATLYIGAHDNRRIDDLEQRVLKLESRHG